MKFNNKGYMLIEIILASAIAFGLMYFIVDLTINLKNKNDDLVVKTSLTTDQSILSNEIISHILENPLKNKKDANDFCNKIKIEDNTIKYNNEVINEVSEYGNITGYDCIAEETYINIKIPIEVKQLPDENFDIDVYYEFAKRKFVSSIDFTYQCLDLDINTGKTYFDNPSNRIFSGDDLFIYTGKCQFERDNVSKDWKVKYLTSGYLLFRESVKTDVFLVGGGGGGTDSNHYSDAWDGRYYRGGGGGGGGYTTTKKDNIITENTVYELIVGAGGTTGFNKCAGTGETSTAFEVSAKGGAGGCIGTETGGGGGGAGGSGGGHYSFYTPSPGGSNGSASKNGAKGQGTTTAEFGEEGRKLYAGGGAGGHESFNWYAVDAGPSEGGGGGSGQNGTENTGGGGGGAGWSKKPGAGGSGIIIVRNVIEETGDGITFSKIRNNYKCNYNGSDSVEGLYFTYTGNCKLVNDSGNNWKISFTSNGDLKLYYPIDIDAFIVGGGGGGGGFSYSAGGGGGEAISSFGITLSKDNTYKIDIGNGGSGGSSSGKGQNGNPTTAFGITANGGIGGGNSNGLYGSGGGSASTYPNCSTANGKSYGIGGQYKGGTTQTTCEFNEAIFDSNNNVIGCVGNPYSGGGGAKCTSDTNCGYGNCGSSGGAGGGGDGAGGLDGYSQGGGSATANTGGGGGGGSVVQGSYGSGGSGGSGIVIIRNTR